MTACRLLSFGAAALLVLLANGCRTPPPPVQRDILFYPPPPEQPRFQYLTSISSPADVLARPSALMKFIFGPSPRLPAIMKPYGLVLKNGKLYVSDTVNGTIHIADLRRKTWEYFQPTRSGRLRKNIGLAVDDDGTMYVSDTLRGQVVIFNSANKFIGELGRPGELKPTAMEIAGNRLYVADMKGRRVVVYDKTSRAAVESIPRAGVTNESEILYQPVGLARDSEGRLFVSDAGSFRIQVYRPDGGYLRTIGRQGDSPGDFVRNKCLALDRMNRLYVVDSAPQIVQLFDAQDRLLMYFGDPDSGEEGEMQLPADVFIDYDHIDLFKKYVAPGYDIEFIVLVSNQFGDRKVTVYGFLRPKIAAAQSPDADVKTARP